LSDVVGGLLVSSSIIVKPTNMTKMIYGIISTRSALLFLMIIASIEGIIQLYYTVYWAFLMNLAIVLSGLSCLYSRGKQNAVIYCRIALYIWFASAMVGIGLGGYFVLHGHEKLKEWCMILVVSEEECSPLFLAPWYTGFICVGCLFGLPFMYFAVKTIHLLYLESLQNYSSVYPMSVKQDSRSPQRQRTCGGGL
jgi:hypothetical protein